MKTTTLLRLYPRAWRERYGDEMLALVEQSGGGWRCFRSLVVAAAREWVRAVTDVTWVGPVVAMLLVAMAELVAAASILLFLFVAFTVAALAVQWASHALPQAWRLPAVGGLALALTEAWSHAAVLMAYGAVISLPMALVARRSSTGVLRAARVLTAFVCMTLVVRALGGPWEIALGGGFFLWRMAYRAHLPKQFDVRNFVA